MCLKNVQTLSIHLLDRYKVSFDHQNLEETWGCLVSKDGQQRRNPFRVKLKNLSKLTMFKLFALRVTNRGPLVIGVLDFGGMDARWFGWREA